MVREGRARPADNEGRVVGLEGARDGVKEVDKISRGSIPKLTWRVERRVGLVEDLPVPAAFGGEVAAAPSVVVVHHRMQHDVDQCGNVVFSDAWWRQAAAFVP